MAKKTNPALIGAFVVGAVLLCGVAALIWGSRALFERKYEYICYFGGSVNGLAKGAPVKYRGVEIGVVKDIKIRYQQAREDTRIPVIIEAWGKRMRELGGEQEPSPELVREMIARGLRARLETLSVVTGVLYVSLDLVPGSPATMAELPNGGILEIPTLPTELEEAQKAVVAMLSNLEHADFKGMTASISQAAREAHELMSTPELRETFRQLPTLISAIHELTSTLNTDAAKAGRVVEDAHGAMTSLRGTLDSARGVVSPRAPLAVGLARTLADVDKAALAVQELADFLRRNPKALIAGTKPPGAAQ
jgi:paraquat-inducible protein B